MLAAATVLTARPTTWSSHDPRRTRSPSSPAPRAAPAAASRSPSARPARPSTAPAAAPAAGARSTTGPETMEETAALVTAAGGQRDRDRRATISSPTQVEALVARIDRDHGRLDLLVNDVWGGEGLFEWDTPLWEHDLAAGLRLLRLGARDAPRHEPLRAAAPDPPAGRARGRDDRRDVRLQRDALPPLGLLRPRQERRSSGSRSPQAQELAPHGCTAVALTPGWLRSEMMLEHFGVTEETWREARGQPALRGDLGEPALRRPRGRRAGRRPGRAPPQRRLVLLRRARAGVRLHRRRRLAARLLAVHGRGAGRRAARRTPPATADRSRRGPR